MPLNEPLSQRRIFWFWLPLAAMWLMMAVEQPMIAAVIARLPAPDINLAAFGITFALALLVEGPVVMLLTAGTALPKDRQSYRRLLFFTHLMSLGLTALHLLVAVTPLYGLIVRNLIGAPDEVVALSRGAFLILVPWTPAIAYRRLWQGVLIRYNRTRVVPVTIAARLITTTGILLGGLVLARYQGVYVGATALSLGVIAAAAAAYAFARVSIQEHLITDEDEAEFLTWQELLSFYVPLALTSLIVLANQPLFSTTLARAPEALLSLAVWPVLNSLLFLGRSIALSYQEAVVALLKGRRSYLHLRRFAWTVTLALFAVFFLIVVTPLSHFWYARISGLRPELVAFAILPTALAALVPAISTLISWQRGILVQVKETKYITHSVVISVSVLVILMAVAVWFTSLPGAVIAAGSFTLSVTAEWLYLWWRSLGAARRAGFGPSADRERVLAHQPEPEQTFGIGRR